MKKPLLVTGSNGLVASRFILDFEETYTIEPMDISNQNNPVDITNKDKVMDVVANSKAEFIIHAAAYTDVTGSWEQRDDKSGLAYQVNVVGTENIVAAAQEHNKHLIHISTAYVFDGEKDGLYTEDDSLSPIEWYGHTKAEAEKVIQATKGLDWTILRIDQPFRSDPFPKSDIAHRVVAGLQSGELHPLFINHYFGPTFLNDFSKVLNGVVTQNLTGLFHATSGEQWSDYEFATAIKELHSFETEVKKGDLNEYLESVNRPYQRNTALDSSKLQQELEFEFTPIRQALAQLEY